jgi:hypothetical protein
VIGSKRPTDESRRRLRPGARRRFRGSKPARRRTSLTRAGIDAFVSRLDLAVEVDVSSQRLPRDLEASAYFIVAEALTNVVKHARATRATVRATVENGVLAPEVRDDGVGGADPEGHGLVGHCRPGGRARRSVAHRKQRVQRHGASRPPAIVDTVTARRNGAPYFGGSSILSLSPVFEMKTTSSFAGSVRLVFSVSTWWAPGCSTQFSPWW